MRLLSSFQNENLTLSKSKKEFIVSLKKFFKQVFFLSKGKRNRSSTNTEKQVGMIVNLVKQP